MKISTTQKTILIVCFFISSMLISPCQALNEKKYSFKISITTSCQIPFQTVSPIVISFELVNIGDESFNGTLTIEGKTDKHSFPLVKYDILNLSKNSVYRNSASFHTIDEGVYFFLLR